MLFENVNLGLVNVALAQEELVEIDAKETADVQNGTVVQEYAVETNSEGDWQLELDNTFSSGLHTVTAVDESGNEIATALFAMEPDVNVYETSDGLPLNWVYVFLLCLWIFLGLAVYNLWRVIKLRKKSRAKAVKSFARFEELFSTLLIGVLLLGIGYLSFSSHLFGLGLSDEAVIEDSLDKSVMVVASGAVVDPKSGETVEGVDLSLGNQSIHTSSSGRFNFNAVTDNLKIRLNHPDLRRAIKYMITADFNQDIYFDLDLMNRLSDLINLEGLNNSEDIYNLVYEPLRAKVDFKKFMKPYDFVYTKNNLADQFVVVRGVQIIKGWESKVSDEKYKTVYEVTIMANGQVKIWNFVFNAGWFLVE